VLLLIASAVFYVAASELMYLVFAGMTLLAWGGCFLMQRLKEKRRLIVTTMIISKVMILITFNNTFFIDNTNFIMAHFFPGYEPLPYPAWVVPLGISYFTLILISYTLDVYWGISESQRNPLKLLLFAGYFPQLVTGPFTRYKDMKSQLFESKSFSFEQVCFGLQRIVWGLFKKLIMAERLNVIVSTIYGCSDTYTGTYIFVGAFSFVLQLYIDFSSSMDIVIGVSQLFGIVLPENFRTPFYSLNLSEFWRRWHITLGLWLKDYVLYPLLKSRLFVRLKKSCKRLWGKKAAQKIPTYCGMFITWFCIGFWHGGSWRFIFGSGLFFFIMIVGGLILEPVFKWMIALLRINTQTFSWILFQRIRTFILFMMSVSFIRAESLMAGFRMWRSAFTVFNPWVLFDGSLFDLGLDANNFFVMVFGLIILFLVSYMQQSGSIRKRLANQNLVFRWAIFIGVTMAVLIFGMYGAEYEVTDFIYGQF